MFMVEVSKDEFFQCIGPKNVHPRAERYYSEWEMVGSREIIGRTEPGYLCRTREGQLMTETKFWLSERFAVGNSKHGDLKM